jgi:hypothetical protein
MLKAKILGKPYAGKLHVRFDEGEEEAKVSKCGLTLYRLPSSFLLYWLKPLLRKLDEITNSPSSESRKQRHAPHKHNNIQIHKRLNNSADF